MKISRLKLGLLVVNILCLLCAIGQLIIGACNWRSSFVETVLMNTKGWCLSLGITASITCLLGLFLMIFASKMLDWLHFLAVIGITIICIVQAILDVVGKNEIVEMAHSHMKDAYETRNYDMIDTFQKELRCCGYISKFDEAVIKPRVAQELIMSCCNENTDKCTTEIADNNNCSSRIAYISTLSSIIAIFGFLNAITFLALAALLVLKFVQRYKMEIEENERYYEDDYISEDGD